MDEKQIIELYFARSEQAISETDLKYGKYCRQLAYNILYDHQDSEESASVSTSSGQVRLAALARCRTAATVFLEHPQLCAMLR